MMIDFSKASPEKGKLISIDTFIAEQGVDVFILKHTIFCNLIHREEKHTSYYTMQWKKVIKQDWEVFCSGDREPVYTRVASE